MTERQEVEALLAEAKQGDFSKPHSTVMEALCRAWLAVEDAPVGEYEYIVSDVAYIHFDNEGDAPNWSGDRVRIVKEAG